MIKRLTKAIEVPLDQLRASPLGTLGEEDKEGNDEEEGVFSSLPYDPTTGKLDRSSTATLDLRPGHRVRLIRQPAWDICNVGSEGTIQGRDSQGHFIVKVGTQNRRLGSWWLAAAKEGSVPFLPVVSISE